MRTIREYIEGDRVYVMELVAQLQDFLAHLDPLKQHRKYDDFNKEVYFDKQLKKVAESNGRILILENEGEVVGAIVGWVTHIDEESIDYYPQKLGYIADLFVEEKERGGAGRLLMEALESYFEEQACDYVAVSYLVANAKAHDFYEKNGYSKYSARMVKKLK